MSYRTQRLGIDSVPQVQTLVCGWSAPALTDPCSGAWNLPVNSVDGQRSFAERDDCCGKMAQRHETAVQLLITHEQRSRPVESTVADLHRAAARPPFRLPSLRVGFLAPAHDVRDVAVPFMTRRGTPRASPRASTSKRRSLPFFSQSVELDLTNSCAIGALNMAPSMLCHRLAMSSICSYSARPACHRATPQRVLCASVAHQSRISRANAPAGRHPSAASNAAGRSRPSSRSAACRRCATSPSRAC